MHWLPALLAFGMGLSLGGASQSRADARGCAFELEALRFVSTPSGDRLPLYWDLRLAAHLTQTFRRTHPQGPVVAVSVVMPLYAAQPMMFRRGAHLLVTTGMLAQISDDAELANQFRVLPLKQARKREARKPSACERILADGPAASKPVWSSLHESLLRYEEWSRPRLKVRHGNQGLADMPPRLYPLRGGEPLKAVPPKGQ